MAGIIPRIANLAKVEANYQNFLEALAKSGFKGEIESSYSARLLCATDNSVYQRMPQAVVFPQEREDVVKLFKLASERQFASIVFAPRGGGTGTNGRSASQRLMSQPVRSGSRLVSSRTSSMSCSRRIIYSFPLSFRPHRVPASAA